jgi:Poly (ADP-ribose) glycohydrolase (PARG)
VTALPEPIERRDFVTATLMGEYRPAWGHPNKRIVYEIACPPGAVHAGRLAYSRWTAMPVPTSLEGVAAGRLVRVLDGYYDYAPSLDPGEGIEWHVNFADPHLFVAYASSLFAQDEMQVAEHPALGALREALVADGLAAVTVERGEPTPVLVMGVERRCRVATDPDAAEGRPAGLYGNAFARADGDVVRRATTPIEPPTITNLIAMAAPPGGYGRYRADEIESVLTTVFTGFRAAVLESHRERARATSVAVHTGYWGCGAFGGNRVLMALLQVLAAGSAGLDQLVFHVGDPRGRVPLAEALRLIEVGLGTDRAPSTRELINRIETIGFEWGVSDGN